MEKYGIVTPDKLNLREKPSTDANILTQLTKNTRLDILADTGTGWLQVRIVGMATEGYVSKSYVLLTDTPGTVPSGAKAQVNVPMLNFRAAPNTSANILGKLPQNTLLDVIAEQADWLQVSHGGQQGYVASQYVTIILPSAMPPSVPTPPPTPVIQPTPGTTPSSVAPGFLGSQSDLLTVNLVPDKLIPDQTDSAAQVVAHTWNTFGGLIGVLADQLNITPNTIIGVLTAESGGRAFAPDGRMIIRFENHIFYQYWGKNNASQFSHFFNFDRSTPANSYKNHQWRTDENGSWQTCHTSQDVEWKVLTFARTLDDTAALQSISMGAPQIMGFNFEHIGYQSVSDMFTNFMLSAPSHRSGRCNFGIVTG